MVRLLRTMRLPALWLMLGVLAACQTSPSLQPPPVPSATNDLIALAQSVTPIPTVTQVRATPTATATASHTPIPAPIATSTTTLSPPSASTNTPLPTITPTLAQVDHYRLSRPIEQKQDKAHWLDRTYPYGGTQFGTREVHLGVEFVNARFTPIFAAAEGRVVFAGDDRAIQFGLERDIYGFMVVIEHPFLSADGQPVFTLYGHLQDIRVETGQSVLRGERIGRVGDSGIAVGPHLHFEVRVGDAYDYRNTRNPDLWIEPYSRFGTLAGRVFGIENIYGIVLLVRSDTVQRETYTYGSERVNSDPAWQENFTLGDLPVGDYEVLVSSGNGRVLFRETVTIHAGQTTYLAVNLGGSGS